MATSLSRRAALGGTAAVSLVGRRPIPGASAFSKLTEAEQQRTIDLLLRKCAANLGILEAFDAEFGPFEPEPGDERLMARNGALQGRAVR